MNSFYTPTELRKIGFKSIGNNVFLSKKTSIYGAEKISIGNNVRIDDFVILSGNIVLGSFVHIGAQTILNGGEKGIVLEDFCGLSQRVCLFSSSDDYSGESLTNPMIPDTFKNLCSHPLILKKHSIVGAGSIILPTSKGLEEGVSVGAMSLVVRPTKPFGVYFGIPAKRISERNKNILKLEKEFLNTLDANGGGGITKSSSASISSLRSIIKAA